MEEWVKSSWRRKGKEKNNSWSTNKLKEKVIR